MATMESPFLRRCSLRSDKVGKQTTQNYTDKTVNADAPLSLPRPVHFHDRLPKMPGQREGGGEQKALLRAPLSLARHPEQRAWGEPQVEPGRGGLGGEVCAERLFGEGLAAPRLPE